MPITKIEKNSYVYNEMKLIYEGGSESIQGIAKRYGITREYVSKYAKKEGWRRGDIEKKHKVIKLVTKHKIIKKNNKKVIDRYKEYKDDAVINAVLSKAEEQVKNDTKILTKLEIALKKKQDELEFKKAEISLKKAEIEASSQEILSSLLESIKNEMSGSGNDIIDEGMAKDENGKIVDRKTMRYGKYSILKMVGFNDILKGTGVLQNNSINVDNRSVTLYSKNGEVNNSQQNNQTQTLVIKHEEANKFDNMVDSELENCKVVDDYAG